MSARCGSCRLPKVTDRDRQHLADAAALAPSPEDCEWCAGVCWTDPCTSEPEPSRVVGTASILSVTREPDGTVTGVVDVPDELVPPRGPGGLSIGPVLDQAFAPDPDWREKIAKAAAARELGSQMRAGKPSSFGWPVGERR